MKENMLCGVHIGEHGFSAEAVLDELRTRVVEPGYNFVTIRTNARNGEIIAADTYLKWAEYLRENKVCFLFLYTIKTDEPELKGTIDKETVERMKEIAGEYFLGDMLGELGSSFAAKHAGYIRNATPGNLNPYRQPPHNVADMKAAADNFVNIVNKYVQLDRKIGMPHIASVEPTALSKYIDMGGVDLPMVELMCAPPDILVSYMRGMARAFGRDWGTYLAHEWYGGVRHDDILKRKRLSLVSKYAYLAGSEVFCIESGDECISSYDQHFEAESDICRDYREALTYLRDVSTADNRHKGGPRVKLAFVSGRYDSYCGWGGSSVWGQYEREEWGHSDPEHSWCLLHEIGTKRQWWDVENYGESDLSALPAYGMYDIVPIEADIDALSKYDYLIFLGWNSMTDEDMDKLAEYVNRGGNLLMSMAHLNYSVKRGGEFIMPPEDKLLKLFGVRATGEIIKTNAGLKFCDSIIDGVRYPRMPQVHTDPILTSGYARFALTELVDAEVLAMLSNSFGWPLKVLPPAAVQHRVGKGCATLCTSLEYPGNGAVYPIYRVLARELITASARSADVKVLAPDRIRYAVYPDGKVYMLNTDYDLPINVVIECKDKKIAATVEPLELKIVEI